MEFLKHNFKRVEILHTKKHKGILNALFLKSHKNDDSFVAFFLFKVDWIVRHSTLLSAPLSPYLHRYILIQVMRVFKCRNIQLYGPRWPRRKVKHVEIYIVRNVLIGIISFLFIKGYSLSISDLLCFIFSQN